MGAPARIRMRAGGISSGGGGSGGGGSSGGAGDVISPDFFGIHIGHLPTMTIYADYSATARANYRQTPWPDISIGTLRLWDADGCTWRNIERSRGVYVWDRLDYYLAQAKAHGAKIIFTLGSGPDWATTQQGQYAGLYVGYNPHPPVLDADWTDWCTSVATRILNAGFPGAPYEIWNEVNDNSYGAEAVGTGYTGTTERLVQLAALARTAIHAVDPSAVILTANFTGLDGILGAGASDPHVTLDKYIAAGGLAYADAVSIHGYNAAAPWTRPEGAINHAAIIAGLLKSAGSTLPVWNTEWGWGEWRDSTGAFRSGAQGTPAPDPMPDSLSASYLTRMLLLSWLVGWRKHCQYAFDAFDYNSLLMAERTAPGTLKPAALAYRFVQSLLVGGYLSNLTKAVTSGSEYYRALFTTGDGRTGVVLWCDDYTTLNVTVPGAVEVRSNTGAAIALTSTIAVSGSPVFVFNS
jgi:hypothetical protein